MKPFTKQILTALVVTLGVALSAFSADVPKGSVDFKNTPVGDVLAVYKELSGCKVVESSDVKRHYAMITVHSAGLSTDDTLKLIARSLVEQAGIVVTRLDDKTVSVTYNDRLPIIHVKD